jgi:signal transduction histidine kinase
VTGRRRDVVIVGVLAVWQVVERLVSPMVEGPAAANVACGVIMASAMWWRATDPARAVAVLLAGGALSAASDSPPSDVTASLVLIVAIGFSVGRHSVGGRRVVAAAALGLGTGLLDVVDYGVEGFLFPVLAVSTAAIIGALLRDRAMMTRDLAERTHELEALREAGERDAVLDERRRIARELHDVVAHTVSVMVVQAAGARRQLDRDPERARTALRQVRATGEDTLAELERLFGVLHAGDDAAGDVGDVPSLVERMRAAGLDVALTVEGVPARLPPGAGAAAYRVVQEALTNALKHARGARASVRLRWDAAGLDVGVVNDAGAGGSRAAQLPGGGHGLHGMRERVETSGGTLRAGPCDGGGFAVEARLPVLTDRAEVVA